MLKARLFDIPLYLTVAGMLQAFVTLLLLGWWAVRRPSLADAARFMDRAALFNALLLSLGCAANSIWMVTIYERWYTSADTVVDFLPFLPFGQWVLDQEFGGARGRLLGGATLRQLQALWLAVAAPVWAGSVLPVSQGDGGRDGRLRAASRKEGSRDVRDRMRSFMGATRRRRQR